MQTSKVKVCILRIEGTWSEDETALAFREVGANPEIVHLTQLIKSQRIPKEWHRDLFDYQILMFPGGFSAGDCIRAGAIWAARCKKRLGSQLTEFIREGYAIGGICNGFQVLVELGLLPAFDKVMSPTPELALATNESGKFECRPTLLKKVSNNNCVFTHKYKKGSISLIPSAHGEGRFTIAKEQEKRYLKKLEENDQIVFKYSKADGSLADGEYPYSPNGSLADIAGICNPEGNVFGMMPHPERTTRSYLHHNWTRNKSVLKKTGDGRLYFESVVDYICKKF
jgi:phosphoribosylformylglycinamidine synthase